MLSQASCAVGCGHRLGVGIRDHGNKYTYKNCVRCRREPRVFSPLGWSEANAERTQARGGEGDNGEALQSIVIQKSEVSPDRNSSFEIAFWA